jgi:hypothetical protein
MKKTKVSTLLSKVLGKDNPYRAIIPFLLATLFFAATITPLYGQLTQITPSVNENKTNQTTTEKATASSMKSETPQPTTVFCPNCGNILLKTEGSYRFCNSDISQLCQTVKK